MMDDLIKSTMKVLPNGDKEWRNEEGEFHREDGPAIENANGIKMWYKNGNRHREDGPAVEFVEGDKMWCLNGKLHRLDGPAYQDADGTVSWHIDGEGYLVADYCIKLYGSLDHPKSIELILKYS